MRNYLNFPEKNSLKTLANLKTRRSKGSVLENFKISNSKKNNSINTLSLIKLNNASPKRTSIKTILIDKTALKPNNFKLQILDLNKSVNQTCHIHQSVTPKIFQETHRLRTKVLSDIRLNNSQNFTIVKFKAPFVQQSKILITKNFEFHSSFQDKLKKKVRKTSSFKTEVYLNKGLDNLSPKTISSENFLRLDMRLDNFVPETNCFKTHVRSFFFSKMVKNQNFTFASKSLFYSLCNSYIIQLQHRILKFQKIGALKQLVKLQKKLFTCFFSKQIIKNFFYRFLKSSAHKLTFQNSFQNITTVKLKNSFQRLIVSELTFSPEFEKKITSEQYSNLSFRYLYKKIKNIFKKLLFTVVIKPQWEVKLTFNSYKYRIGQTFLDCIKSLKKKLGNSPKSILHLQCNYCLKEKYLFFLKQKCFFSWKKTSFNVLTRNRQLEFYCVSFFKKIFFWDFRKLLIIFTKRGFKFRLENFSFLNNVVPETDRLRTKVCSDICLNNSVQSDTNVFSIFLRSCFKKYQKTKQYLISDNNENWEQDFDFHSKFPFFFYYSLFIDKNIQSLTIMSFCFYKKEILMNEPSCLDVYIDERSCLENDSFLNERSLKFLFKTKILERSFLENGSYRVKTKGCFKNNQIDKKRIQNKRFFKKHFCFLAFSLLNLLEINDFRANARETNSFYEPNHFDINIQSFTRQNIRLDNYIQIQKTSHFLNNSVLLYKRLKHLQNLTFVKFKTSFVKKTKVFLTTSLLKLTFKNLLIPESHRWRMNLCPDICLDNYISETSSFRNKIRLNNNIQKIFLENDRFLNNSVPETRWAQNYIQFKASSLEYDSCLKKANSLINYSFNNIGFYRFDMHLFDVFQKNFYRSFFFNFCENYYIHAETQTQVFYYFYIKKRGILKKFQKLVVSELKFRRLDRFKIPFRKIPFYKKLRSKIFVLNKNFKLRSSIHTYIELRSFISEIKCFKINIQNALQSLYFILNILNLELGSLNKIKMSTQADLFLETSHFRTKVRLENFSFLNNYVVETRSSQNYMLDTSVSKQVLETSRFKANARVENFSFLNNVVHKIKINNLIFLTICVENSIFKSLFLKKIKKNRCINNSTLNILLLKQVGLAVHLEKYVALCFCQKMLVLNFMTANALQYQYCNINCQEIINLMNVILRRGNLWNFSYETTSFVNKTLVFLTNEVLNFTIVKFWNFNYKKSNLMQSCRYISKYDKFRKFLNFSGKFLTKVPQTHPLRTKVRSDIRLNNSVPLEKNLYYYFNFYYWKNYYKNTYSDILISGDINQVLLDLYFMSKSLFLENFKISFIQFDHQMILIQPDIRLDNHFPETRSSQNYIKKTSRFLNKVRSDIRLNNSFHPVLSASSKKLVFFETNLNKKLYSKNKVLNNVLNLFLHNGLILYLKQIKLRNTYKVFLNKSFPTNVDKKRLKIQKTSSKVNDSTSSIEKSRFRINLLDTKLSKQVLETSRLKANARLENISFLNNYVPETHRLRTKVLSDIRLNNSQNFTIVKFKAPLVHKKLKVQASFRRNCAIFVKKNAKFSLKNYYFKGDLLRKRDQKIFLKLVNLYFEKSQKDYQKNKSVGFDFEGFSFLHKKYSYKFNKVLDHEIRNCSISNHRLSSKVIVLPSKNNIRNYLNQNRKFIKSAKHCTQEKLILRLTSKIKTWSATYNFMKNKKIQKYCDYITFKQLWKWACRRHPTKSKKWIKFKYFNSLVGKSWVFGVYKQSDRAFLCIPNHIKPNNIKVFPLEKHQSIYNAKWTYWKKFFTKK